jgi:AraC-like DNA-binding protein
MKVTEFNIEKGLYFFEFEGLDTEFHSHPAMEIVGAEYGTFSFCTENSEHNGVRFAVIGANMKHKLFALDAKLKVLMVEHHTNQLTSELTHHGINLQDGFYIQTANFNHESLIAELIQAITAGGLATAYDERVAATIRFLNNTNLEYSDMSDTLKNVTKLSESRLSHLFKMNLGISLKRYLVWNKLKSTIQNHLNEKDDLFTSLIKSGFYDQPHFSKSFKSLLGVKPSKAYNSRIVQAFRTEAL